MRITGTEDLRIQKTMDAIDRAFGKLLQEKDYGQITATEVCREAKIGKKTFYTYYSSLDALLQEKLAVMAGRYLERIAAYRVPEDIEAINREFYVYSEEQGPLYERLVCSAPHRAIGSGLLLELVHRTWQSSAWLQSLTPEQQNVILAFVCETGGSLYRHWARTGKTMPMDTMIQLSGAILRGGLDRFAAACK